jgi:protein-tyrosine-phosphatase/predicted ATP-grasp superfamily ATP-dependent carboligase
MKEPQNPKVLVLGVDDRSALTVIRSLGRKKIEVHQGVDVQYSVAALSRYISRKIDFPSVATHPHEWLERLKTVLQAECYELVIPTADNYLVQIVQHRQTLAPLAKLAIPDDRGFEYTYKKSRTLVLAKSLGVPIPISLEVTSMDQFKTISENFKFPVIVKPVSSKVWQQDVRYTLDVSLAKSPEELRKQLEKILPICPVIIQSFHSGIGVGQEFLMKDGEPVAMFQHERVHEPLGGGGSSYRKSAKLNPVMLKHSLAMLKELKWTGVAMVEYKYNRQTEEFVLMEINGRFWGSLPLAVAAGVDFPWLLYDMLVNNRITIINKYKVPIYARNPVKDLNWLKENIRADKNNPFLMTVPLPKVLSELVNVFLLREKWDTIVWDDPYPGIKQLWDYFLENLRGAIDKLQHLTLKLQYRYNPLYRWWLKHKTRKLLKKQPSIAMLCKGNICRSPFAELYLCANLNGKFPSLHVESYGLIERINRPSPENAIAVAKDFGVDLKPHRSKLFTEKVVEKSGIIFVMDFELYLRVKKQFPTAKQKLLFLGAFQKKADSPEILDPYGGDTNQFKKVYQQIVDAIQQFIKII